MNSMFDVITPSFLEDDTLVVTRRLLGQRVVRRIGDDVLVGRIVEAEAYGGTDDSTSHAFRGPTPRAAGMYGPVGRSYVYLIYGMYSCLNIVAHPAGGVGAVLVRALMPEVGVEHMRARRPRGSASLLTQGPGRLCMALGIDRTLNALDLCDPASPLFLAHGAEIADDAVSATPRVGVVGRPEDVARPWRLAVRPEAYPALPGSGYTP